MSRIAKILIPLSLFATTTTFAKDEAMAEVKKAVAKAKKEMDMKSATWKTKVPKPEKFTFDSDSEYFWLLDTSQGKIRVRLMPEVAPMHVSSTIYLTELGFYDDTIFHRVIPGFMAQGGCPLGNGRGNPGYSYVGEFDKKVRHNRGGYLSMANAGPGTDGSQFFLTFVPTPWLDDKHTIFGEITEGLDTTMKELEKRGSAGSGRPTEPLKLNKATIEVKAKPKKEMEVEKTDDGEGGGDK